MKELLTAPDDDGFPLDLHHLMVFDSPRLRAFERALKSVVRPGDTVLDVGSGTGILSFLAWRAGAGRVVGLERGEIVETARRVKDEYYADAPIEFLRLDVQREALPDLQADVIVCELIGNLGPEEEIVPIVARLRSRVLKPGGHLIPSKVRMVACPVEAPEVHEELTQWSKPVRGVCLASFEELAYHRAYHLDQEAVNFLAEPRVIGELDLCQDETAPTRMSGTFEISSSGELHGMATWIEADLAPKVTLSTGPDDGYTHWGQVFLPSGPSRSVSSGTQLGFELNVENGDFETVWSWKLTIGTGAEATVVSYSVRGQS
jgi:SAM-dependent methyltransferase